MSFKIWNYKKFIIVVVIYLISFCITVFLTRSLSVSPEDFLHRPISSIDFGNEDQKGYLKEGFSFIESDGQIKWRWSNGDYSIVKVPLKENVSYDFTFEVIPFQNSDRKQAISVYLNNTFVDTITLDENDFKQYSLSVDRRLIKSVNEIKLVYNYSISPSDIASSNDTRKLAVRFKAIHFKERV